MSNIAISGCLSVGPYKTYHGRAEYESDTGLFHGEVTDTKDVITFVGGSPSDVTTEFQESIDEYLAFCEERGESPEKPFSGRFALRMLPELHRNLAVAADRSSKSLNQFIVDALAEAVSTTPNEVVVKYVMEYKSPDSVAFQFAPESTALGWSSEEIAERSHELSAEFSGARFSSQMLVSNS